jgi:RimJ/RimL family protein N-acetyltransferase
MLKIISGLDIFHDCLSCLVNYKKMNEIKNTGLEVRELQYSDIELIINYWLKSDPEFLTAMGVDLEKIPEREHWQSMLEEQLSQNFSEKKSYCIIWLQDGNPIGHSNVNKIQFGKEAYMHLHLWKPENRRRGMGLELIKKTIPYFFRNLDLQKIFSEPNAMNPAPNKALERAGFSFLGNYVCIPGWINTEQEVNLWVLEAELSPG